MVYADQKKPIDYYKPYGSEVVLDSVVTGTYPSDSTMIEDMATAAAAEAISEAERVSDEEAATPPVTVKRTTGKKFNNKKTTATKQTPAKKKKQSTKSKSKKKAAGKKKTAASKKTVTKHQPKVVLDDSMIVEDIRIEEATDEIKDEEMAPIVDSAYAESPYENDGLEDEKNASWYRLQDSLLLVNQSAFADSLINRAFTSQPGIVGSSRYQKVIDASADISYYISYDDLFSGLWAASLSELYRFTGSFAAGKPNNMTGYVLGGNMYFDKDKVRLEQKMFTENPELAKWTRAMYDSKQKKSIATYVNPNDIAYFSGSINTEATSHYYYTFMRNYMGSAGLMPNGKEAADAIVDMIELVIDEKAIAELVPGNFVFALHNIGTKKVSYTTYDYDSAFNQIEIKKVKDEMSPDFSIVFETHNPAFVYKLLKLPVKYSQDSGFVYKAHDGYFEWIFDAEKDIINHLYLIVKGDRLVFTTSKAMLDLTLKNGTIKLPKDLRKKIFDNNYSMKLNSSKLIEQLSRELSTGSAAKIKDYLRDNLGDMEMNSYYKDGMVYSNGYVAVKGNHSNSLEFFFNLIDTINRIYDEEKHTIEVDGIELDSDATQKQTGN
ncbi:MAG TPA: DUF4836 family protein [Flavihumibacter sp.]|nr:DUF4836 family protein [Flavihumibacter sp.]